MYIVFEWKDDYGWVQYSNSLELYAAERLLDSCRETFPDERFKMFMGLST